MVRNGVRVPYTCMYCMDTEFDLFVFILLKNFTDQKISFYFAN